MAREFSKPFYNSKEWADTREYILKRDNYLCTKCGRPAEEVHHIKHINPRNVYDVSVTLNPQNLTSLCKDCHFEQHREDRIESARRSMKRRHHKRITNEDGTYFDDDGMLVKRKVHIVYGAPRSGKTTYIKRHMQTGDAVIDTDYILSALSFDERRHTDPNLLYLALDVRDYLIDQLSKFSKNFDCRNVWIVGGFPKKKEREELAEKVHADLIYIESTFRETEERAKKDNLFNDIQYSIDVVAAWWSAYEK